EALTVCRNALDEPQSTQRSAVKRVTLVLRKSEEVGAKVLGSDSSTPTAIPFLEEIASAAKDTANAPANEADHQPPRTSVLPEAAGDEETAVADAAPPVPVAAMAPSQPAAVAAPAPAEPLPAAAVPQSAGKTTKALAVVAAIVLVGLALALIALFGPPGVASYATAVAVGATVGVIVAAVLVFFWRSAPTAVPLETVVAHAVFLKSAREMLKTDAPAAVTLLQQARKLSINDPLWRQREQAVEDLVKAYELFEKGADDGAVEQHLDAAGKTYPGDQTIELLRERIRRTKEPA
ncbi:MAG: hypothetical protein NTW87_15095, partial [Planctomycetota bacterium]|nr:hypothetical protein [Planctomycetota bacterium]